MWSDEVLELSIEQTNELRRKLGIALLRCNERIDSKDARTIGVEELHDERIKPEVSARMKEHQAPLSLKRKVQEGIQNFGEPPDEGDSSTKSWVQKLRTAEFKSETKAVQPTKRQKTKAAPVTFAHKGKDYKDGSTTVLTLQDSSLLSTDETTRAVVGLNTDTTVLENVELAEEKKRKQNLQESRKAMLGAGRAGGYIGLDDDEFEDEANPSNHERIKGTVDLSVVAPRTVSSDFLTRAEHEAQIQTSMKFKKRRRREKDHRKFRQRSIDESETEREVGLHKTATMADTLDTCLDGRAVSTQSAPKKLEGGDGSPSSHHRQTKSTRFDDSVQKGSERARHAFSVFEDEDDFWNDALDKTKRLDALKQMRMTRRKEEDVAMDIVALGEHASSTPKGNETSFSAKGTLEFLSNLKAKQSGMRKGKSINHIQAKAVDSEAEIGPVSNSNSIEMLHQISNAMEGESPDTAELREHKTNRGVGNVLQFLKTSGQSSLRDSKEEQRGRANDERTCEDYAPVNLASVVNIDQTTATAIDSQLANKEVRLEYRDRHGRLLTRKQAFREMSYQFHGHGSGKRKQERRKHQIGRDQAMTRLGATQGTSGTFSALKATQEATGKAYVVHKTQT